MLSFCCIDVHALLNGPGRKRSHSQNNYHEQPQTSILKNYCNTRENHDPSLKPVEFQAWMKEFTFLLATFAMSPKRQLVVPTDLWQRTFQHKCYVLSMQSIQSLTNRITKEFTKYSVRMHFCRKFTEQQWESEQKYAIY